jgi:tetratricopeptide (TPR) repeat protein
LDLLAVALAAALLLAAGRTARAQDSPREAARWHYAQGLKLAGENGYEAALDEFSRAYQLSPQFAVLYNIGQCQVALGRRQEALEVLSRYLREGEERVPPERRLLVEAQIAQLRALLAEAASGRDAAVDPRQAAYEHTLRGLELAGRNAYRPALHELEQAYAIDADPALLFNIGQCHVALGHLTDGIQALSRYLREGQDRVPPARRDLVQVQVAMLEARLAELTVTVDHPEVVVTVDGRVAGRTPLAEPIRLAPGTHTVAVGMDGMLPATQTITLAEAERRTLAIKLPRQVPLVTGSAAASASAARAAKAAAIEAATAGAGRSRARGTGIPADGRN